MLELKNVRKTYHTKAGAVNALDGISLTFPTTGLVFISGKSGCGKTTLLNVIGGLDGIDEGEIYIQDKNFSQFSAKEYDSYRNTLVGFIFQEYNLLAEYTVEYNIKIAMELQGVPVDEAALEKLLKDMDIEALRHRKPSELSGGQRQRVAIARALVKQPRIIMADEPTGALDSATGAQVFDTLKKLSKEKLILVVSHDNEFAEKYADRIVYLVDGKIVNDITFTETELSSNVSELDNAVIVREGSDLSPQEKDVLAKAVKERKKIEVTEKVCFRDKQATGEITTEKLSPIAFKKSKMKLKTSAYLGIKSLAVKPIRLIFTILISAFAFALFGLFDAVASFTTETCLHHRLKQTNSTVVTTASYIVDHNSNDKYELKVSDELLDTLSTKTGGKVKGIFDLSDNITGNVLTAQTITEIASSNVVIGKRYYANSINGFIEFDEEKEINENGTFKDFDYTLKLGKYPHLYSSIAVAEKEGHEVAISTYLADSILYHLNGQPLNEKTIEDYNDLLGCTLSIQQTLYKIVGIIDCGKIPSKYDEIKNSTPYNSKLNTLLDSFDAFINSGAQKCFFVAQGFREAIQKETNSATIYYAGTAEQAIILSNTNSREKLAAYVYNSKFYDENNVILFNQDEQNGQISLADDEVLVHCLNLDELLAKELNSLSDPATKRNVLALLSNLEKAEKDTAIADFTQALQLLNKTEISPLSATIYMRSKKTGETVSKEVKIVGFYFNVDTNRYASSAQFKLMMNEALMDALSIYSQQGDHSKILFSKQSVRRGANLIVDYLTHDTGLAFTWHCDSVLTVIQDNEPMIRQAADLFLYGALALAVFSIFMLYNYISTSIANKRRSVGVLRALGAGGKDIFLTFLCESLLIGLINGILANALCLAGCTLVNAYIMNTMNISVAFAIFSIRQIPLIAGIGLLTSVISSSLPIIKISKKKPVELIRRS